MPPPPPPSPSPTPNGVHLSCSHTFAAASSLSVDAGVSAFGGRRIGTHYFDAQPFDDVADRMVVRFSGSNISPQARAALVRLGATQVGNIDPNGVVTYSLHGTISRTAAQILNGMPGVVAAGPVVLRHTQALPNDPFFAGNQWDMFITQMPAAWNITKGLSAVHIAIIDSGYDTGNTDLVGKVDKTVVFDQGTGQPHVGASIEDKSGHGSDTSGIAAADTNNNVDVAGTAWNVHLLEARVFPYTGNPPQAFSNDVGAAIDWARLNGANVISMSLGSSTADPVSEEPAVQRALNAGIVVVAASGNSGQPTLDYPARDPGVISVGASAYCDQVKGVVGSGGYEYVAGYSNWGGGGGSPAVSLVAPGGDPDANQVSASCTGSCIDPLQWITNLDSLQGPLAEEVSLFAGTSMATPHVAGAAALMLTKHPGLSPAQVLTILQTSADKIGDNHQGAGRLNTVNALIATP